MQQQQQTTKAQLPRDEVKYCSVDRVGAQAFFVVCTTLRWQVFRLDKFSSSRDSLTPVQIVVNDTSVGALLSNVRMLRLFHLPGTAASTDSNSNMTLGGFFVSERCDEVDYSHTFPYTTSSEMPSVTDSSEDLTIFSFSEERVLKRLPPTSSFVVDLQIQRTTAAVLCESHEILLVDVKTCSVQRRITALSSLAMALGPRWIAYPELSPSVFDDDSDSDDGEEIVPEALVHGASRQLLASTPSHSASASSASTPSSYNAIDVAQNVASGIYFLSKTIAPYLSTSPANTLSNPTDPIQQTNKQNQQNQQPTNYSSTSGWVTIQDVKSERVVSSFKCHSTALVHLSFDSSGCLLATSSTKGQNVHVYRLLPPLQQATPRNQDRSHRHQLLYKLQRGITHASIADMSFSQDAKWLGVTSAHGTSHLYAIHPEGAAMSVHTHATVHYDSESSGSSMSGTGGRDVSDFCASLRAVEPKTLSRVLKIHHSLLASTHTPAAAALAATAASTSYGSFGLSTSSAFFYNTPPSTIVGSALDASQALFSQLAQSTGIDFGGGYGDQDGASGCRRRRRMSGLFAHDGLKMVICCDSTLKLYDLAVHSPASVSPNKGLRISSMAASSSISMTKTRSSPFGFDATVSELKSWDLSETSRVRTECLASAVSEDVSTIDTTGRSRNSEMRTFLQRGLPLWAHPKVSFRVVDSENPEGLLLQIKRKGPSTQEYGGNGVLHDGGDDQQLFVMEMDSYFGLGGSPIFTGQPESRVAPEVPRLDLAESMNLAISSSLKTPSTMDDGSSKIVMPPEVTEVDYGVSMTGRQSRKMKKMKKKTGKQTTVSDDASSESSSQSTSASTSPTILQFTLQDLYFAQPTEQN